MLLFNATATLAGLLNLVAGSKYNHAAIVVYDGNTEEDDEDFTFMEAV